MIDQHLVDAVIDIRKFHTSICV